MSTPEIPLLRESAAFAARLVDAAARRGEPKYHAHRRANWSHRYSDRFYAREVECFNAAPDAYLTGQTGAEPDLPDVYAQRLRPRQVIIVLMKVMAHWLFHLLGGPAERRLHASGICTYRKCYVDDIELVFDPAEAGVIRAIYPFPLNLRRQLRYLTFVRQEGYRFKLAGNPYLPADLVRFLLRRDVRSMMRLESRAQLRHAREVATLGVDCVQLSDEFDIGSLDFTRRLRRTRVRIVNSAHGVGKYLPVHAYHEFHVLTGRQQEYYHAVRPCSYGLRRLNDRATVDPMGSCGSTDGAWVHLVWLSQKFAAAGDVIADNESQVVDRLRAGLAGVNGIALYYKPHPNSNATDAPTGFRRLTDLAAVNGRDGTVFASFFSTCQIDPAFKGHKVLVNGHLIFPRIAFDDSEPMVNAAGLVDLVRQLAAEGASREFERPLTSLSKCAADGTFACSSATVAPRVGGAQRP